MTGTRLASNTGKGLLVRVLTRFALAVTVMIVVLFLPAWSLNYWNGWLYLGALFVPMTFTVIYFYLRDPALLEKRLNTNEREKEQQSYVKLSLLLFVAGFVLPGFDFRFGWSNMPVWLVVTGVVLLEAGYVLFILVMKENSYASRIIEIQENQKLIDTGLYALVRHPMYLAASMIYLSSPLILGSFFALIPIAFTPMILGYRAVHEEQVLKEGLEGYREYTEKVRYRLVPFLW